MRKIILANRLERNFFGHWFEKNARNFPWRRKRTTPFAILLTEMLLRQTRAEGVAKLWKEFTRKYRDPKRIAQASQKDLIAELRILGFSNQKAVALQSAANYLLENHGGKVPNTLDDLLKVPHIGQYSARAILCFAFGNKTELVDTNILRFLSRFYGVHAKPDIRRSPHIWHLARAGMPRNKNKAQTHNYGLLDFTAAICTAQHPKCGTCPLSAKCKWIKQSRAHKSA